MKRMTACQLLRVPAWQITHLLEADQQLRMGVSSDFLVRELKERPNDFTPALAAGRD